MLNEEFERTRYPKSWVYFALNRETGLVKIGRTATRRIRLKKLQREHGDVVFIATSPGDSKEEAKLHKRFAKDQVRGEWFSYSASISKYIALLEHNNGALVCSLVMDRKIPLRACRDSYHSIHRGKRAQSDQDFLLLQRLCSETRQWFDCCFEGCPRAVLHKQTELCGFLA